MEKRGLGGFTFQIDPQVVGVEDLELANLENISLLANIGYLGYLPDLKSSTCSDGT